MTPETLIGLAERNSRNVELMKRTTEQELSDLTWQQLALEQDISTRLGSIAALHLEHGNAADSQVSVALQARKDAREQLDQQLQAAEQQVADALAAKQAAQARYDGIDQQARERLEQNPEYARQVAQLDQTQAEHREHISGYLELREEYAKKRPTFDADPIYCYLRSHRFGTEHYQRNRLHLAMDRWLAKQVNYTANRKNELSLIAMGERNESLQLERQTLIEQLSSSIDAQLQQAREQLGLTALHSDLCATEAAIDNAKARANTLQKQLADYALNQDPHYLRTRELLTEQLKTRSLGELVDLASQTPDTADDRIVEQLQTLHVRLLSMKADQAALKQHQQALQTRYERAKELQRKLRNEAFTGSDVYFDLSTDFEELMARYMEGDVTLGRLIDALNQARTIVRRSQAAAQRGFVSATTTSYSFTTTTVSASNAAGKSDGF